MLEHPSADGRYDDRGQRQRRQRQAPNLTLPEVLKR